MSPEHCFVAPHPDLADKLKKDLERARGRAKDPIASYLGPTRATRALGFDDGMIFPPDAFPLGTPAAVIRNAAMERAPLRGAVRVIVVLVDFSDKAMSATVDHFKDLFFSTGVLPNGSVKEYYKEVTNGLVDITGDVVGTYRMPQTLGWYANGNFGIGRPTGTTRARDLARDAAVAADPAVNFGPYDNDGNGFVDAFIVVHAGRGGEETGNSGDIWSHKWALPSVHTADTTKIFGYLTIPEDAKLGVCAHELGHLLFGFPDLYDTDDTSEGIGNWCLMAGGSWNGGGDIPAHPSAWCKINQGWASVTNVTTNQAGVSIPDVKTSRNVLRLWKDGTGGAEYFLVENRQRTGFDAKLPGDGLLIWHIDDSQPGNTDETHYKVALMQADGNKHLELKQNRGDGGDPYPGTAGNTAFSSTSTPNSKSYTGLDTCVAVTKISAAGATMTADLTVRCGKSIVKELKERPKDFKDIIKERKELKEDLKERPKDLKEIKEGKEEIKERKEIKENLKERPKEIKEFKEGKEIKEDFKEARKDVKEFKEQKEFKEFERPFDRPFERTQAGAEQADLAAAVANLSERLAALEAVVGAAAAEPFIRTTLRPDLMGGPVYEETTDPLQERMQAGDRAAKREYDSPPL